MAYLPQQVIDEVRSRVDIVDLIADYVSLQPSGENFKGLCPFHQEQTPSFVVSPRKQLFHCFGCGAGGNVFHFLMRYEHLSFPEAVSLLAQRAGIPLPRPSHRPSQEEQRKEIFYQLNTSVTEYYQHLLQHPTLGRRGQEYLRQRGITAQVISTFRLGYAPPRWDTLVKYFVEEQGRSPSLLQTGGLIKPRPQGKGFYDLFRDRIIFPILDLQGRPIAFGGRALESDQLPKYLNSPETPLYKKGEMLYGLYHARQAIRRLGYVLVVEGYFDLLTLWQAGIENVVATLGTSMTRRQAHLLRNYTREIVLVFDGDQAGKAAAFRGNTLLMEAGINVRLLVLPAGTDPDTLIRTQGKEAFLHLLDQALPFIEHLIRHGEHRWNSIQDKLRYIHTLLPLIAKVARPMEQMEYLSLLAEKTRVSEHLLHQELRAYTRARASRGQPSSTLPSSPKPSLPSTVTPNVEKDLIQLMLEDPTLIPRVQKEVSPEEFTDREWGEMACLLFALAEKGVEATPAQIIDLFPRPQLRERASQLLMRQLPLEHRDQLLEGCLSMMRDRRVKREQEKLKALMKAAESRGDFTESTRLLQRFMALQRERKGKEKGEKAGMT
ncbi:MAG: DNA primase [Nitrospinota bacterium]|nr:MAG: DNA primase [Nitrospinota bacterium]